MNDNKNTMNKDLSNTQNRRNLSDRRIHPIHSAFCSFYKARRIEPQRFNEQNLPYYTDFYERKFLILMAFIMALSIADGILTLEILAKGGVELNPLMAILLDFNISAFLIVKYSLTAIGLAFVLLHINFSILRILRVRNIIYILFLLYSILVAYEITLLNLPLLLRI